MSAPLTSISNQFVFNLPTDFITPDLDVKLTKLLRKNRMVHDTALDYLNSSIKTVTLPTMSIPYATQKIKRGKEVHWKGTHNIYDTLNQQIDVTFNSFDSHMNYVMLRQCIVAHYLNQNDNYASPLTVTMVDVYRNPIVSYTFRSVLPITISELQLSYADQRADEKTFTVQFQFSWMDVEYMDGSELIRMDEPLRIDSDDFPTPANLFGMGTTTENE